jgi:hypothetical protein|tara:strand:+ start:371 stop:1102 length:732 start_codon:yes stop_codon:yes gene_type:complete
MKKLTIAVAVTGILTACGTSGTNYSAQYSGQNGMQTAQMSSAVSQAPVWMSKLPKADGYIFENGTATSGDFGFADIKAKTMAYAKICTAAGGKIRSQVKMFKSDSGDASMDQSEMALRSMCPDVDITGVETVEMKHVSEGNRIRTYVLVTLPLGGKNVLKTVKDAQARAPEAFKELDEITSDKKAIEVTPVPAQRGQEISVARPDGSTSTLNLMPVENAEYKARREEALKKPGAVIGQVSVAN